MNVCGRSRFFGGEAAFAGCFENAGIGIPLRLLSTTSAWTEYLKFNPCACNELLSDEPFHCIGQFVKMGYDGIGQVLVHRFGLPPFAA